MSEDDEKLIEISVKSPSYENALQALAVTLKKMGLSGKSVGLDLLNLLPGYQEALQKELPQAVFKDASETFRQIRQTFTEGGMC